MWNQLLSFSHTHQCGKLSNKSLSTFDTVESIYATHAKSHLVGSGVNWGRVGKSIDFRVNWNIGELKCCQQLAIQICPEHQWGTLWEGEEFKALQGKVSRTFID